MNKTKRTDYKTIQDLDFGQVETDNYGQLVVYADTVGDIPDGVFDMENVPDGYLVYTGFCLGEDGVSLEEFVDP